MSESIRGHVVIVEAGAPVRRDAVVDVEGGRVVGVRDAGTNPLGPAYDVVLPGLIDAHSHGRGVPLAAHGIGQGPLERFLIEVRAMTPLPPVDEALVAADLALAAGITSVQVIHHDFGGPAAYAERARASAKGYATAGIRAFITLGLTDQDEYAPATGPRFREATSDVLVPARGVPPESFPALASQLLGERGLVMIDAVGPVAPQWCSDRALRAIASVPGTGRVHAHLLESQRQRLAADPVARLGQAGLLSSVSSFAHGIWLDDTQVARLARTGATVVHCPGSNARLGAGTCPVHDLLAAGVSVALGLDSNGAAKEPDMFAEMRLALRAAAPGGAPLTATEVLAMATTGGARALARSDLGTLQPGAAADIVGLRLPGIAGAAEPAEYLIQHATRGSVAATWVGGQPTRSTPAAAEARERIAAVLREDAPARAARLAEAAAAWAEADQAWRTAEGRSATGARSR